MRASWETQRLISLVSTWSKSSGNWTGVRATFVRPSLKYTTHTTTNKHRSFSANNCRREKYDIVTLPSTVPVSFREIDNSELLCLRWSEAPRNILLVKKDNTVHTSEALKEFATHIKNTYPGINIILEPKVASELNDELPFDIYTTTQKHSHPSELHEKVDLVTTFGGDGTILHAASMFASADRVPPMLSFGMGTLGFLGEWKFEEYKRAFREAYMSGSNTERKSVLFNGESTDENDANVRTGWSSMRGKSMGTTRAARVLVRQRLKVGVFDAKGVRLSNNGGPPKDVHAMNEVLIHRGRDPHLAIVEVYVGGRFLTEAVADGMIVSTPTGSTAYSLSSGGSIIHPLVSSLLLTPVCPRSLSFRPLILPSTTPITLKLSERNRGREMEVSVDGMRRSHGIGVGTELRVSGEEMRKEDGSWQGGIPCIMRRSRAGADGDDGWVGGLNSLLKFNHPFGEER